MRRIQLVLTLTVLACLTAPASRVRARARVTSPSPPRGKVVYPKLLKFVKAPYPEAARKASKQGVVLLHVTVSVTGKVTAVTVARSLSPLLDAAAVKAAGQFVYKPATVDGKPVGAKIQVAYSFRLRTVTPRPGRPRVSSRAPPRPRLRPPPIRKKAFMP